MKLVTRAGVFVTAMLTFAAPVLLAQQPPPATSPAAGAAAKPQHANTSPGLVRFGVEVRELSADILRTMHIPTSSTGVLVLSVKKDGAAAKAGVQPGDIIMRVSGERVESATHLNDLLMKAPAGQVPVWVVRMAHLKYLMSTLA